MKYKMSGSDVGNSLLFIGNLLKMKMRNRIMMSVVACGLAFGFVKVADAEPGFYWGIELAYESYGSEIKKAVNDLRNLDEFLRFGYTFPVPISLELELNGDVIFNGDAPFYGAGVVYHFLADQPFKPFVNVGWGRYALDVQFPLEKGTFSGDGYHVGFGFDYNLNRITDIGFGITKRYVTYDHLHSSLYYLLKDVNADRVTYGIRWQINY